MNNFMFKRMPAFIKKEVQIISEVLQPKIKKHSKFLFFAIPLIGISIIMIIFRLIKGGFYLDNVPIMAIYALVAAIGLALYKESKYVEKEIEILGIEQMIQRINKSEHMNDYSKEKYINTIKNYPSFSFQAFLSFLNEENKRKQSLIEN